MIKKLISAAMAACMILMLATCSDADNKGDSAPFDGRGPSDLSGYESMSDYDGEIMLSDTTVKEVDELMSEGASFAFIAGFDNCPFCDRIMPYFNEAAKRAGVRVGYINTRKDPSWESNMDIDNYDLFVKRFGDWLQVDEDGYKHLYTPDSYFIKDGKVVARYNGEIEGMDDPKEALSEDQIEDIYKELAKNFEAIK